MADLKQFKLPDVGEGLTEAEIVKWHVRPGDTVEVNQTIVEIETAKAVVELPCPFEGTIAELFVDEGQTVDVGTPIVTVDAGGDGSAEPSARPAEGEGDLVPSPPAEGGERSGAHRGPVSEPPPEQKRQPVLVGYGIKPSTTKRRPRKSGGRSPAPATTRPPATGAAPSTAGERPGPARPAGSRLAALAKPPVRKLAKDLGVDLTTVAGTGPHGSVTRDDIRAATGAGTAPATTGGVREERVPIKGVRKHTASAMVSSAFTAPHVTEWLQVDVTATMEAVPRLRALPEFEDVKVSPLLLVAKALMLAVRRHPMVNAAWDEQAQEIVVKHYVNLGIAAATERGLIVPNIKDAHALPLPDLARGLVSLTDTARAGKASLADLTGGTVTITNVGVFGVDAGTPILTPGESAILAFGQVRDMPWVHEGELAIRKVTTLAVSFDHRVVDGELGSALLRDIGAMLEDPLRMLAWS